MIGDPSMSCYRNPGRRGHLAHVEATGSRDHKNDAALAQFPSPLDREHLPDLFWFRKMLCSVDIGTLADVPEFHRLLGVPGNLKDPGGSNGKLLERPRCGS